MSTETQVSTTLTFFVNGKKVVEENPDPEWTLLFYLRRKLRLCGTKLGCGEGGCGACTVMVSRYVREKDRTIHMAINACLAPVCAMHGLAVTTVEGIGSTKTRLHPVQERIAKAHGSQCGFCTPGIVMSMYTLLRNMPKPSYKDLEVTFQGNLCRCTGYRPILEGYKTFIEDWEIKQAESSGIIVNYQTNGTCQMGDKCCKNNLISSDGPQETFEKSKFIPLDPQQEPIFPPELKLLSIYDSHTLLFKGTSVILHRPQTLRHLTEIKKQFPNAKIVNGNTEIGVETKVKNISYPVIILTNKVPEVNEIALLDSGVKIGSAVSLAEIEKKFEQLLKVLPSYKTRIFQSMLNMLHWFAGKQVRNVASLGGNIMTGSPISDLNPILLSAGATLEMKSSSSVRSIVMDHTFFTGYRTNKCEPDEVLVSIFIPFTTENQYFTAYKQSKRRDDDIAIVNMALKVEFNSKNGSISSMNLAFGGMGPTTILAKNTSQALVGQLWNENMIEKAFYSILDELQLENGAPGGMIKYRRSLTLSIFFKCYLEISEHIFGRFPNTHGISFNEESGVGGFHKRVQQASQYFSLPSNPTSKVDPVGRPIVHSSGFEQATGEAAYCDDMPLLEDELFLSPVLSTKAHARILSIDPRKALSLPGVRAFFCAKDIEKGKNVYGPMTKDDEIFVSETVTSQGQVIGAIVAESQTTAIRAAKSVQITYDEISPVLITIEDAINANSYYNKEPMKIVTGDINYAFGIADHVIENEVHIGGQEHFYLETNCSRAIPKNEDNEIEIYASNQKPAGVSASVANVLGVPINRVITKVKRIGGGFGGKQSRGFCVTLPVAIAAHKLQVPVRCMLDRDQDMIMTGGRHPFYVKYKIAFMKTGKIVGVVIHLYNNGGCSMDLSPSVIQKAMLHCDNAYNIPNIEVLGYACKTNIPSNTAFRGFGAPQAMFVAEHYIRDVASKLGVDPLNIVQTNLYKEGQITFFQQTLTHCTLERCLEECMQRSNFIKRRREIENYNSKNRWKKRGISICPTKYGIAFGIPICNQAGALVLVYTDGSVLLSHSGTEMGQGLHIKMLQVAARALQIDISKIHISETSTDKIPNPPPTAASISSDLNGMAIIDACNQILSRLEPIKNANPNGTWENWISEAYTKCINLSAVGYYSLGLDIGYNMVTNTGTPYNYFTFGAACSEVEIDCLTGDHRALRTDIVMDVGESLNPAIDIGQIEGAFMQGYGLFTMEELIFSPMGALYSKGPGAYKIPSFSDVPTEFNVSLLKGAPNPRAVYSSKAVGEPPLFLAASVFFAIKDAISSARREAGRTGGFLLRSPATVERIRMACEDHITAMVPEVPTEGVVPWNVVP